MINDQSTVELKRKISFKKSLKRRINAIQRRAAEAVSSLSLTQQGALDALVTHANQLSAPDLAELAAMGAHARAVHEQFPVLGESADRAQRQLLDELYQLSRIAVHYSL